MSEAAQAAAPTPGIESTGSITDIILAAEQAQAEQASPASAAATAPAKETPGFDDPLDESLFADEHLKTPEQVRAKAAVVRAQVKEALEIRRKAHNARAEAERREAKFKQTKAETLREKSSVGATAQFLQGELVEIQSGDPDRFIAAIARLSKHSDPPTFWREVAVKLAQGPKPAGAPAKLDPEQQARLDRLEAESKERAARDKQAADDAFIAEREAELFAAPTEEAHPLLQRLRGIDQSAFETGLRNAKMRGFRQTGKVIDNKSACDMVEAELKKFSELRQQADGPDGNATREKDAAALVAGQDGTPGRSTVAKTEPAQSPPPHKSSTVTTVPSSLTGEPSRTKRALSPAEQRQAVTEQLDALGFFSNFGF